MPYATDADLSTKQNSLTFSAPFYLSGSTLKLDKGNKGGSQWIGDTTVNGFGTGGDIYFTNGNVGIGTITPSAKLDVYVSGSTGANIISGATYILKIAHTNLSQGLAFGYKNKLWYQIATIYCCQSVRTICGIRTCPGLSDTSRPHIYDGNLGFNLPYIFKLATCENQPRGIFLT
jgi:hypothetical protein